MADISIAELKEQFQNLDPQLPVALFPVRLQVRFATPAMVDALGSGNMQEDHSGDPPSELWVRIYPDDILVQAHEEKLSEEEMAAAEAYWNELWTALQSAPPPSAAERARVRAGAWQSLADDFGPVRARYILRVSEPVTGIDAEGFPPKETVLQFPDLELTPGPWNEAPRTYLLPERFVARLERGGAVREIVGNAIQKEDEALILGIDPNKDEEFTDTATGRNLPEEIRWMTDFERAVEIGMGMRIPLTEAAEQTEGFDRLYVLGWLPLAGAEESVERLQQLLDNHRYKVGGMDLAPPGTATNNTREFSVPEGPDERPAEESLALAQEADGDDPVQLAKALGLPEAVFSGLDHSQLSTIQAPAEVHELLFDATLGQALDYWQPDLSDNRRRALRDYMKQWVRGRGLLPALRIDNQPYAFLPALPFSLFKTNSRLIGDTFLEELWTNILNPLDDWFADQVANERIPRIRRNLPLERAQTTLLEILQHHPMGVDFRQRFALDRSFFDTPEAELPDELDSLKDKVSDTGRMIDIQNTLTGAGFAQPDNLDQLFFDNRAYPLAGQEVDVLLGVEGDVIPPLGDSGQNYLEWLAGADTSAKLTEVRDENLPGGGEPPVAVLYRLLRYRLLQSNGAEAVRTAIAKLAAMPVADLRLLVQEHLDCCTYRLDAWIGGLAGRRLTGLREQRSQGVHIGAWGYLESVKPKQGLLERGEFIPAPSLRHATAAAVLRSGYQANRFSSEEGDGLFAVNLSSSRVKDALFLLEGVRNGQDLSALLGYRLERAMQEYRDDSDVPILAELIYDLREIYPFRVNALETAGESAPAEVKEDFSQRVINAIDLLEAGANWADELTTPLSTEQREAMEALLAALDGNLDSVKDLLAAEGVYQLVDGQMDRAKAALDAMTEGEQLTRPEIVEIPRSSLPLTFRMGVLFPDRALPTTGSAPLSPRALIGAKANRWLFDRLPDPTFIRVRVRWESADEAGNTTVHEDSILLRDLLVEPIDLAYMMHLQRENPDTSELRYRIERVVRRRNDLPLTQRIQILDQDRTGFNDNEFTLFAVEPLAAGFGKMLLETRTLRPEDFLQPNDPAKDEAGQFWAPNFLRAQLRNVALQVEDNLESFANRLEGVKGRLDSGDEIDAIQLARDLENLRESMFFYAGMGWIQAVPTQVEALNRLVLEQHYRLADNIFREATQKVDEARELLQPGSTQLLSQLLRDHPADDNPQEATEKLEEIISRLFGRFYKVYPDFRLPNPEAVAQSLASPQLEASQAGFAVDRWVQSQAPVRPRMDLYHRSAMLADIFGESEELQGYDLLQLPLREGATGPWVGQEYGDFEPHPDTLAMTLELQTDFDLENNIFSGILIDDWTELAPDPTANTGIAMQYDQPDMEAPNAVLLAMTHAEGQSWNWDNLVQTVADTILMAKKRGVDPDLLKASHWDQLLPGLLGAIPTGSETGDSLNFGDLPEAQAAKADAPAPPPGEKTKTNLSEFGMGDFDFGSIVEE